MMIPAATASKTPTLTIIKKRNQFPIVANDEHQPAFPQTVPNKRSQIANLATPYLCRGWVQIFPVDVLLHTAIDDFNTVALAALENISTKRAETRPEVDSIHYGQEALRAQWLIL